MTYTVELHTSAATSPSCCTICGYGWTKTGSKRSNFAIHPVLQGWRFVSNLGIGIKQRRLQRLLADGSNAPIRKGRAPVG